MLGILIPGVREVRAPLVAGALLLVSVYLLLFDSAESALDAKSVSPGLESLYDVLGRNGLLIAAALVAYLLGTVFTRFVMIQLRGLGLRLVPAIGTTDYVESPSSRTLHFLAPYSRASISRICVICEDRVAQPEQVLAEIIVSGGKRLLIASRDLYAEYDRLRSEIELRMAVVLPALVLTSALVMQVPATATSEVLTTFVVVAFAAFILADAVALNRQANSMYAHAVADGVVSTPSLDKG